MTPEEVMHGAGSILKQFTVICDRVTPLAMNHFGSYENHNNGN